MEKILISACLLGERVKYHGGHALVENSTLDQWRKEERLVIICPEVSAGFPTPRRPSEIIGGGDGEDVLSQSAKILNHDGTDVTDGYIAGAKNALALAIQHQIKIAILKENSPSCGSSLIYDGTFTGKKRSGKGTTSALLAANGIRIFSEFEIHEALILITKLEAGI